MWKSQHGTNRRRRTPRGAFTSFPSAEHLISPGRAVKVIKLTKLSVASFGSMPPQTRNIPNTKSRFWDGRTQFCNLMPNFVQKHIVLQTFSVASRRSAENVVTFSSTKTVHHNGHIAHYLSFRHLVKIHDFVEKNNILMRFSDFEIEFSNIELRKPFADKLSSENLS